MAAVGCLLIGLGIGFVLGIYTTFAVIQKECPAAFDNIMRNFLD